MNPRLRDGSLICRKELVIRIGLLLLGIALMGLGAAGTVSAMLGSDPVTAFIQGLSHVSGLRFGAAMNLFNLLTLCAVLLTDCRDIHLGTLLSALLTGMFSDGFLHFLSLLSVETLAVPLRIAVLLCSNLAVGAGLGTYQAAGLGISPGDALNQIISRRLEVPLGKVRVYSDLFMTAGAVFLGGIVYVGTLTGIAIVGPVMGSCYARISRRLEELFQQGPYRNVI